MSFGILQLDNLRALIMGATITQAYGPADPATGNMEPPYAGIAHFHEGVDLVLGGINPAVAAPASGRVIHAGYDTRPSTCGGFGNYVEILAPNGYTYLLGHLNDLQALRYGSGQPVGTLRVGDTVHAGDIIGHEGSTGCSSGPHVHLQITNPQGVPVDPGSTNSNLFYTLYHSLGFGAGYVPGQVSAVPDPLTPAPWAQPVPSILPTNPNAKDRRYYPGRGFLDNLFNGAPTTDPIGTPTGQPTATDPGTTGGSFFGFDIMGALRFLLIGGVATGFLIIGLIRLGHEGPVQQVVAPVQQAAGSVVRTTAKAAAVVA